MASLEGLLESQERRYQAIIPLVKRAPTDRLELRESLHRLVEAAFDMEELSHVAYLVGVDLENLPGKTKTTKARELILHFMKMGEMWRLMMVLQQQRPSVDWPDTSELDDSLPEEMVKKDDK